MIYIYILFSDSLNPNALMHPYKISRNRIQEFTNCYLR